MHNNTGSNHLIAKIAFPSKFYLLIFAVHHQIIIIGVDYVISGLIEQSGGVTSGRVRCDGHPRTNTYFPCPPAPPYPFCSRGA